MKDIFKEATRGAVNLQQVRDAVVALFDKTREKTGSDKLGYVAGIIGSDGEEKVAENRRILQEHADRIRAESDFPIFSATDIFENLELWERLEEIKWDRPDRRQAFIQFWREILELGRITDIFMTPRWEQSEGANDEHETAQRLEIAIHYVE